ncbi:hypothetical protein AALI21_02865 [Corynebacteriaceae bacterium 6-324]
MKDKSLQQHAEALVELAETVAEGYRKVGETFQQVLDPESQQSDVTIRVENPTENIHAAARIIRDRSEVDDECLGYAHSYNIAMYLDEAGLMVQDPQIISTFDELEELDPDTQLMMRSGSNNVVMSAYDWVGDYEISPEGVLPLAVLVSGEQVRAARKALGDD